MKNFELIVTKRVASTLGVTQKRAWFMLHRVRLAMKARSFKKLSGEVEADEIFIGGKMENMHKRARRRIQNKDGNNWGKTVVLGLLQRDGDVRAAVAPNRRKHAVDTNIRANLEAGSKMYTDEFNSYMYLKNEYAHEIVNHLGSYVSGRVRTNGLENFWSLPKRTLKRTYVSVDPAHLFRYLDEQCFRFNRRSFVDATRFALVIGQVIGRQLTYAELTGKSEMEGVPA